MIDDGFRERERRESVCGFSSSSSICLFFPFSSKASQEQSERNSGKQRLPVASGKRANQTEKKKKNDMCTHTHPDNTYTNTHLATHI